MRLLIIILLSVAVRWAWAGIDTLYVSSASMKKNIPVIVVTPRAATDSLPVVFLLHGYGGNFGDWQKHTDLQPLADAFHTVLVCPDGSPNSWYLDSPLQQASQYETFVAGELPEYLRRHYPLRRARRFWAITGLSMGGHGALYLAIRHPGQFGQMAAMSGGVDLTWSTKKWEIAQKLGPYEHYPERWQRNSVVQMVKEIRPPYQPLLIDCGVGDIFIDINRTLHARLLKAGIPHDYVERPGGHSWAYWVRVLPYHLMFFREHWTN